MRIALDDHHHTPEDERCVAELLMLAFVAEGHTSRDRAQRLTDPTELARRGSLIVARAPAPPSIVGMVIFAQPSSPYRQIALPGEAEVQLLAVHPAARGHGIGGSLLAACEERARGYGYGRMVLSTQPAMAAAQRLYERSGYLRNPARDWTRHDARRFLVYEKRFPARPR